MCVLEEIIRKEIEKNGPIPFSKFMEIALYNDLFGYYSKAGKIGKLGDFYTSPSVDSLFGKLLGKQIEQMLETINEKEFSVIEMGAGNGHLAKDILSYFKERGIENKIKYTIIERFPTVMKAQRDALSGFNVEWKHSIKELSPFGGVFLSNELVDSFPTHRVVMDGGLMEVYVDCVGGRFKEVLRPAGNEVKNHLSSLGITLAEGQRAEVNLSAMGWVKYVGAYLKKGFVVTIDYGYPSGELYSTRRRNGTFLCYHKHKTDDNPYEMVGNKDMTSHVDFTSLAIAGKSSGLEVTGFTYQSHFLIGLGAIDKLSSLPQERVMRIKRLITPEDMGGTFKVLVQHKGVFEPKLAGFSIKSPLKLQ